MQNTNASVLEISSMIQSQQQSIKTSNLFQSSQMKFFHLPKHSNKQSVKQSQIQSNREPFQIEEVFLDESDIDEQMFDDQIPPQQQQYEYHHFDQFKQMEKRHKLEIQKYQEVKVESLKQDLAKLEGQTDLFYQDLEGFDQKLNRFKDDLVENRKKNKAVKEKQKSFLNAHHQVQHELFEPLLEEKDDQFDEDDLKIVYFNERNKNQELFDEIEQLKQKYQYSEEQEQEQESDQEYELVQSIEIEKPKVQNQKQNKSQQSKYQLQKQQFSQNYLKQLKDNKNIKMNIPKSNKQKKTGKPPLNKNVKAKVNNRPTKLIHLDRYERDQHLKAKIKNLYIDE